jgi:hypothetical protein
MNATRPKITIFKVLAFKKAKNQSARFTAQDSTVIWTIKAMSL